MRVSRITLWGGTALIFFLIAATGNWAWLGVLAGYWTAFVNSAMLARDTVRSTHLDVFGAVRRMRFGFFVRLGIVTMIVGILGRWQKSWLPGFAVGIALGLFISLFSIVKKEIFRGKG